jgi:putative glycosyltransferase (TIGR04348 family)
VQTGSECGGETADLLIALHARRSAPAVRAFRNRFADRPIVVALTGTDLYRDLPKSRTAMRSVEEADRLIVLQPEALRRLTASARRKTHVIHQSVRLPKSAGQASSDLRRRTFDVCVIGHLRPVKDPFRAAMAARRLPAESKIRILHLGGALDPDASRRAELEERRNPRYHWLGALTPSACRRRLERSHVMVLSSRMEGGANVIGEAAVAGVPILASRIEGSIGLLGPRHPGFFDVGDTQGLRDLMLRSESERGFYRELKRASREAAALFRPERERRAWRALISELQV